MVCVSFAREVRVSPAAVRIACRSAFCDRNSPSSTRAGVRPYHARASCPVSDTLTARPAPPVGSGVMLCTRPPNRPAGVTPENVPSVAMPAHIARPSRSSPYSGPEAFMGL